MLSRLYSYIQQFPGRNQDGKCENNYLHICIHTQNSDSFEVSDGLLGKLCTVSLSSPVHFKNRADATSNQLARIVQYTIISAKTEQHTNLFYREIYVIMFVVLNIDSRDVFRLVSQIFYILREHRRRQFLSSVCYRTENAKCSSKHGIYRIAIL